MSIPRWPILASLAATMALALSLAVTTATAEAQQRPANPLTAARSWGYQLQNPKVSTLVASGKFLPMRSQSSSSTCSTKTTCHKQVT